MYMLKYNFVWSESFYVLQELRIRWGGWQMWRAEGEEYNEECALSAVHGKLGHQLGTNSKISSNVMEQNESFVNSFKSTQLLAYSQEPWEKLIDHIRLQWV